MITGTLMMTVPHGAASASSKGTTFVKATCPKKIHNQHSSPTNSEEGIRRRTHSFRRDPPSQDPSLHHHQHNITH
jgi:hypothetical protein